MKIAFKLLCSSILCSTFLFANADDNVIDFEINRLEKNPDIEVLNVEIATKKELPVKGWNGYILDVEAKVKSNKVINAKDVLFSDGEYIALDLLDAKTGKSLKDIVTPNLTANYYDESKLIAGNHKAKDKLVVFSDPLCPFCMDYIPDVIKYVNKNSNKIALYYYHYPLLKLHPAAGPLSKIMEVAKHQNIKNLELRVYEMDWDKYFKSNERDEAKILKAFNTEFKTNITVKDISIYKVKSALNSDIKMGKDVMVSGTPSIFVNGVKDNTRLKFETLGK